MKLLAFFLTLALPALAHAQGAGWYAGAGLMRLHTHFEPDYTFALNDTPMQFINEADGAQVDLTAGRRQRVNDRFSLGIQGTFSVNRFEWSLSIPSEPAELRYSLPRTFVVAAVPEVHFGPVVSAFVELGGGVGLVREIKTAPITSNYNINQWQPVIAVGAGARFSVAPNVSVVFTYRRVGYSGFEYDTFNAAGVRIEHVKDKPSAKGLSFGVRIDF